MKKKAISTVFALTVAVLMSFVYAKAYAAASVLSIEIKSMPVRTEYYVGDSLSTTGLSIRARLSDGTTLDVSSGLTCTPKTFTQDGSQKVTVSYGGQSATYDVSVKIKPCVVTQPKSVTAETGKSISFTYEVKGKDVTYQWYFKKNNSPSWTLWKGHTQSTTWAQTNSTWNHIQLYCAAVDAYGNSFTSKTVSVTLSDILEIYSQPNDLTTATGQTPSLSVKSYGKDLTYKWYIRKAGDASAVRWKEMNTSEITFAVDRSFHKAEIYCVITDGSGHSITSRTASVRLKDVLEIVLQPRNVTADSGTVVRFTVTAQGSGVKYQWYYKKKGATSWSLWKGHTTASTSATANDSWSGMLVRCLVTDSSGEKIDSNAAVVTITGKTELVESPKDVTAAPGEICSFSVTASGTGLSYQWYFKKKGASAWSLWKGHTSAATSAKANDTWDGMKVCCVIQDSNGKTLSSSAATVTIQRTALAVKTQPRDVSTVSGGKVTFAVKAEGDSLSYQWYYKKKGASSWSLWKNHTASSTTATANDTWNGMNVRCQVRDYYGNTVYSSSATVTIVKQVITITRQPSNISTKANRRVTMSVAAEGDDLSYQWYYRKKGASDWSIWYEFKTAAITPPANNSWDGMQVRCLITDANDNSIYSNAATITILPADGNDFRILKQPQSVILGKSCLSSRRITFSVDANGTGMTFQWYCSKPGQSGWSVWSGHNTASTTCQPTATWNGMMFYCVITNGDGEELYSDIARITIADHPITITSQPSDVSTKAGSKVSISVAAKGTNLSYQWYYKKTTSSGWSVWKDYRTAAIEPFSNNTWDGMQIYCKITDMYGNTLDSKTIQVTILPYEEGDFRITKQPENLLFYTSDLGNYSYINDEDRLNMSFSVQANGSNMTYQWYCRGKNETEWKKWDGATAASTPPEYGYAIMKYDGMRVYCVVTNGDGRQVYSNIAYVSVIVDN